MSTHFQFKIANQDYEFTQIHRLNYKTFVEEIPQHAVNQERSLIDRFHHENLYCIAKVAEKVVGMLCVRATRPFSLDGKVANLDQFFHAEQLQHMCEIRLLAIEEEYRHSAAFSGLLHFTINICLARNLTMAVVSATVLQEKLYANMGFTPFSTMVGKLGALYQPMYLTLDSARHMSQRLELLAIQKKKRSSMQQPVSFLPGPVQMHPSVQMAFSLAPISHRSPQFYDMVKQVKMHLRALTQATNLELLFGSGTLANDVVAGQLGLLKAKGLVLVNGEFGARLVDHAQRQGLIFETLHAQFGEAFDLANIREQFASGTVEWCWATHCETSSGVLNPLEELQQLCDEFKVKLCMDCTSSVGCVPVNLSRAYLATTVSGKALGAYAGIAVVFYNHAVVSNNRIPRYLDLGYYAQEQGVPFTQSSNLLCALLAALEIARTKSFDAIRAASDQIQAQLNNAGLRLLANAAHISPAVLTIQMPATVSSVAIGDALEENGFLLSYQSAYLRQANLLQICLMGATETFQHEAMLRQLCAQVSKESHANRHKTALSKQA